MAHAFAGADSGELHPLKGLSWPSVGIVTACNDMLSAHRPYEDYPAIIKSVVREVHAVAQVAGGVPTMCDGVTQGRAGMKLSLLSRDVIAMSTAVALAHDTFDAALMLGVCDKIIPGMLMALSFGHLSVVMVPAAPMPSGLSNGEKAKVCEQFSLGEVSSETLLDAECAAYHGPGTCTFYGTAPPESSVC
jgi:phosphogluconate dehydratase